MDEQESRAGKRDEGAAVGGINTGGLVAGELCGALRPVLRAVTNIAPGATECLCIISCVDLHVIISCIELLRIFLLTTHGLHFRVREHSVLFR